MFYKRKKVDLAVNKAYSNTDYSNFTKQISRLFLRYFKMNFFSNVPSS